LTGLYDLSVAISVLANLALVIALAGLLGLGTLALLSASGAFVLIACPLRIVAVLVLIPAGLRLILPSLSLRIFHCFLLGGSQLSVEMTSRTGRAENSRATFIVGTQVWEAAETLQMRPSRSTNSH
jgi:hypothetical protein